MTVAPRVVMATSSGTSTPPTSTREFPSLPPKSNAHAPVPRKHEGVAPTSVWGGGSGGGESSEAQFDEDTNYAIEQSKKGKKKGKQVLMQFG